MSRPITVHALLCHSHVEMGIACFGSMLRYSQQPLRLRIHDDGSLTEADMERLQACLPDVTFLLRRDADAVMAEVLRRSPACVRYRQEHPLGLKLLDIAHFTEGDLVTFADSDVLFLRPFSDLFALPDPETGALFMSDVQSAYSLKPLDSLKPGRVSLPQKVNTGLIVLRKSVYDLERIEWFLAQKQYDIKPYWREQTCFAMLAARGKGRLYD